jgi:Na+/proline symporter
MYTYGFSFIPVNLLFLTLGILLLTLGRQQGLTLPTAGDELLPFFAAEGRLGLFVLVLFSIGIIAAAFSSADSALTALTTSFCVDILGIRPQSHSGRRKRVHLSLSILFVLIIWVIQLLNNKSVIDAIYTIASYTYGPLLGMFAFGLFTHRKPRDKWVPLPAIGAPLLCYLIDRLTTAYTAYRFGYELLMLNGLLTFLGLYLLSLRAVRTGNK